jgi:hypothetical protein
MTSPNLPFDPPVAPDTVGDAPAPVEVDPYVLLDELMVIVEELFKDGGRMLL